MSSDASRGAETRYRGYSDYETVSKSIARAVDDAVHAYARLSAMHAEGAKVSASQAADARARITAAAMSLRVELEENDESVETCKAILGRWTGDGDDVGEGYLSRLDGIQLTRECPDWLGQLVADIRAAGFHTGYLQAGRTETTDDEEFDDRDVEGMFEE